MSWNIYLFGLFWGTTIFWQKITFKDWDGDGVLDVNDNCVFNRNIGYTDFRAIQTVDLCLKSQVCNLIGKFCSLKYLCKVIGHCKVFLCQDY